jgi:DNA-binding response OmpR family regulator
MLTIVVIDGDIAIRTLFCEWLETRGWLARGRSERSAAVEPDVDLVVLDLPNLSIQGNETVRQAKSSYPGAAIIGTSTRLNRRLPADSTHARSLSVDGLVPKPCTREELLAAVADAAGPAR